MLLEVGAEAVKRTGVQTAEEPLDDEPRTKIEPRDCADHFGSEVLLGGGQVSE